MYRKKKFHQLAKRNQKSIVSAIIRKAILTIWIGMGIFMILSILYEQWEFLFFAIFIFCIFLLVYIFRLIKRRELRRYFEIDHLQKMSPTYFELYIIELFNALGYNLEWVGGSGDQGIDGKGIDPEANKIILQTKRYSNKNKIQPSDIREFIGTLEYHDVPVGIYVTTGFGTLGIHEYILNHTNKKIIFVDKDRLVELINIVYKDNKNHYRK